MIIGITDRTLYKNEAVYLDKIDCFLSSDIDYLILRDKDINIIEYEQMLVGVLERNYQYRHKLIVHTHLPLALKHGITKVHLPESYIYNTAFNRLIDDDEALIDSLRFMIPNLNQKLVSKLEVSYSLHPKEGSFDEETQMAIEKAKFFFW